VAQRPTVPETQARAAAAEMLGRVKSARSELQLALSRAIGSSAEPQLAEIIAHLAGAETELTQALDTPGASRRMPDLAGIARLLRASEATAAAALQIAAGEAPSRAMQDVATTAAATRQEVEGLSQALFQRRLFDPYLRFASAAEEAEYRAREAERQRAIADQLARRTPEGDLRAGGLVAGQMLDAHAHGAGASGDFLPRWERLTATLHRQRQAMQAAGQSTAAFDHGIAEDARDYLRHRGLSPAEIEAKLEANSPLEAVKPHLTSTRDVRALERATWRSAQDAPLSLQIVPASEVAPADPAGASDLGVMAAKLRAAGVQVETSPLHAAGHGLAVGEGRQPDLRTPAPR
jgi:hypothetical protein